ncbi:MAG: GNAT family N-acetyltransferase [Ruminococcus sp.]|nr:GNAT family N-acetyltransferase [Ruminococcus sp.]
MGVTLRKATENDAALIVGYLKKLAEYENLADVCNITPQRLTALMHEENGVRAIIAELDGVPVGMLTWYTYKIATFSGKRVFYIEDVFIDPHRRSGGIGTALFDEAKRLAEELNCARLEWKCLDWNTSAQKFYSKIGGKISDDGWLTYTINLK